MNARPRRLLGWLLTVGLVLLGGCSREPHTPGRPNFLLVITDDQSWRHTSMAGYAAISTPNFDQIARDGLYFPRAYAAAPTCTASRSALFAGQHVWRTGDGAVLWGTFPGTLTSYQQLLEAAGYAVGYTGKGWGPGKNGSKLPNPAGHPYHLASTAAGGPDHAAGFARFLDQRRPDQPFSFVVSRFEPHRPLPKRAAGSIALARLEVPGFLPDTAAVRDDLADYLASIQYQDRQLQALLDELRRRGLLDNTLVILTSDNGMPFPRAKSNLYEYGVRVPLALQWPAGIRASKPRAEIVSLTDLAPTVLTVAGIEVPAAMTGRSLTALFDPASAGESQWDAAFSGFERHIGDARAGHQTYPMRAIHTARYAYIHNFAPQRWPAGDPPRFADIDEQSPTKQQLLTQAPAVAEALARATGKRPREELYDLQADPFQLHNLADDEAHAAIKARLKERLFQELAATGDPLLSRGDSAFAAARYWGGGPAR